MSTRTPNFELVKPALTDPADITAFNENWDKVDAELKRQADATTDVSGQINTHNTDTSAHADIRQDIEDAKTYTDEQIAKIPKPDVSAEINSHNTNTAAHSDIRTTVTTALNTANNAQTVANSKAPMYTYGNTDLEDGVTPLEAGKLHFVYE